jgi:hypothetical protein
MDLFDRAYEDSLVIVTAGLPSAGAGRPYRFSFKAKGEYPPYRWRLIGGDLPQGLRLGEDGVLSGTPQIAQVTSFVVQVLAKGVGDKYADGPVPSVRSRMRQFNLAVKAEP